ncbi:uncharacterized protein CC84DRAFT_1264492 [Paraphaeosphaeria sporulosa]|uniref:Uncharacterized protein n=1 Tax=Paraphaeosphaeria sporulosa TaxID=1460663 RepID=A0A177BWN5_9PLEO|nr:uncharacterized protein CC84DRAFT_1264492 [Paraphaeosphaeria sporulosa]OAF98917.1 hypothetical protein CC84DRAFT_1264492 [Paraphaeosphaeria sporulosa]
MSSSARLLLLPRELRNRIYTYLTHPLDFTWHRGIQHTPPTARPSTPVPVRIPACPLAYVFLIHPLITAEYKESCLPHLEAVLNPPGFHALEDLVEGGRDVKVLQRVRHVTLFVQLHARSTGASLDWGDQLQLLGDVVTYMGGAGGLKTLRVAVRQHFLGVGPTVGEAELDGILEGVVALRGAAGGEDEGFLPEMPGRVGGLGMVQRGEGLSVGFGGFVGGGGAGVRHAVRKVGVCVYACGGERWERRTWRREEVIRRWPMRAYVESIREVVGEERAAWLMKLPYEMVEWVER